MKILIVQRATRKREQLDQRSFCLKIYSTNVYWHWQSKTEASKSCYCHLSELKSDGNNYCSSKSIF